MLQLSHFKLLAGVVFALFVLTACGGGDSAAPAAATDTTDDSDGTGDGGNTGGGDSGGGDTYTCTDAQFDNGTECVAKVTSCTDATKPYLDVANNQCIAYTSATCESASKFWRVSSSACETNYSPKALTYFDDGTSGNEYSKSKALAGINAAQAYENIEALIDADNNSGAIKQGGAGRTVSVMAEEAFHVQHQEFGGTDATAFDSVYRASTSLTYTRTSNTTNDLIRNDRGNCKGSSCAGTRYASLIAGRKGGGDIHGIAYNAQLKGFVGDRSNLANIIPLGVGANIVAMNHAWTSTEDVSACSAAGTAGKPYSRPLGLNVTQESSTCGTIANGISVSSVLSFARLTGGTGTELQAWIDAVADPDSSKAGNQNTNKTIMVFGSGLDAYNSENGRVGWGYRITLITNSDANGDGNYDTMDANIPAYRAAYPALYEDDDLEAGRWLVVTGLDADDEILYTFNGCGVAMHFCLAAPADGLNVADSQNTYGEVAEANPFYASSTVAGALAVLKGAFPNATPEQLTRLVLETSDYIALDNMTPKATCVSTPSYSCTLGSVAFTDPDSMGRSEDEVYRVEVTMADGVTKRYINPVYGYGKLNLKTATTPSVVSSYVTASNNTSIGALWKDTQLTLSSHFGTGLDSVKLGIGDEYGRHFTVKANKITSAPVAVASFDEYMGNMLADTVQSQKLGGQAKLNYSNSGQPWMNLEYVSGKATSKIAFQDNYKISPLNDSGATSILRANHIRPASNNIGMMDIDYALNGALSLSSYAARGEYDTGYKFDELGTDFDVNYKKSHLNIGFGNIREHDQFLGTHTTGGYALNAPTVSRFTDVTYGHDVGNRFNIYANYINYETDVDMLHDQFASIDGLQADQYQIGFTGKNLMSDDDNLNVALITKLGVTDGALNQNTTLGYTADGGFNDVSQSYDLAVSERHQQFEITYQGKMYQNSQDGVSVLKDNRFFTTIRVDQNLNHVQGASQTEIVSGINARF